MKWAEYFSLRRHTLPIFVLYRSSNPLQESNVVIAISQVCKIPILFCKFLHTSVASFIPRIDLNIPANIVELLQICKKAFISVYSCAIAWQKRNSTLFRKVSKPQKVILKQIIGSVVLTSSSWTRNCFRVYSNTAKISPNTIRFRWCTANKVHLSNFTIPSNKVKQV